MEAGDHHGLLGPMEFSSFDDSKSDKSTDMFDEPEDVKPDLNAIVERLEDSQRRRNQEKERPVEELRQNSEPTRSSEAQESQGSQTPDTPGF